MRLPSHRSFAVLGRHLLVYRNRWRTDLWPPFLEPVIALGALGFGLGSLIAGVEGRSYLEFLAPGIAVIFCVFAGVFECTWGAWFRLDRQGTFQAMIATPVSVEDVTTGEILYGTVKVVLAAVAFLIPALLLGAASLPSALLFLPVAVLIGLMFTAMSLAFTSVAPSMNFLGFFFTLFISPMMWIGGTFSPVSTLPEWVQPLVWAAPLTHAVTVTRSAFYGELTTETLISLGVMLVVTLVFYAIVLQTMRRRLIK